MSNQLQVIDGIQKEKVDYYSIYRKIFLNELYEGLAQCESQGSIERETLKRVVFSGLKMINSEDMPETYEDVLTRFHIIGSINTMIGWLTPRELMQMFPVEKHYDGDKYEMKDYFYTMRVIEEKGLDNCIGTEREVFDFISDYQNSDITSFMIESLSTVSALRRAEGQKGLLEEFAEEKGIDTYTMGTDHRGKQVLVNNTTGEVQRVIKKRPRYIQPVD
ncbi:hypothetical protein [Bacillus sp. WMMC1349]|uniref:hypothetical protein n=1 Tax=Bacillus sp. WMMC1349 TaxID=2736254 RepID=UPI001C12F1AF|nr:hypothetical protein [Bacillus sp. WMMC1349]